MTTPVNRTMSPLEWGMLLILSLFWGGSFFFVGIAVKHLPPLTIVTLRVSIAALILWLSAPLTGLVMPRTREVWSAFARLSLVNNVAPFCLIVWGQTHLASGLAAILNATTPLFTVFAAHVLTRDEIMTPMRLAGALCGLVGVAAMIGPQVLAEGFGANVAAELAILAAAASYAIGSIYGRRFRAMRVAPIAIAAGQATAASAMLIPIALLVDRPWSLPPPGTDAIAAVVALASVSTALAYILYFRILAGAGATNVVLVTLLVPVSSILLGALFLQERLAARHFVGLLLIALGLAFIDGRPFTMLALATRLKPGKP
jgi:drug/metabolite transporter (DMT)-like permease